MTLGDVVTVKVRKQHKCIWCGEQILIGEEVYYFHGQWDGEWQDWRMHMECYEDDYHVNSEDYQDGFTPYLAERPKRALGGFRKEALVV